jgi:hypothetical protein
MGALQKRFAAIDAPAAIVRILTHRALPARADSSINLQPNHLYDLRKRRDVRAKLLVVLFRGREGDMERHGAQPLAHVGHGDDASNLLAQLLPDRHRRLGARRWIARHRFQPGKTSAATRRWKHRHELHQRISLPSDSGITREPVELKCALADSIKASTLPLKLTCFALMPAKCEALAVMMAPATTPVALRTFLAEHSRMRQLLKRLHAQSGRQPTLEKPISLRQRSPSVVGQLVKSPLE